MNFESLFGNFIVSVFNTYGFAFCVQVFVVVALVQLFKMLLPKLKIDLYGKFDPTVIAPFVFGLLAQAVKLLLVDKAGWNALLDSEFFFDGLSVGAVAVSVYKLLAATDKDSLKNLLKEDVFNLVYSQLLLISDAKEKLAKGDISLAAFIKALKLLVEDVNEIYADTSQQKDTAQSLRKAIDQRLPDIVISEDGLKGADILLGTFFRSKKVG